MLCQLARTFRFGLPMVLALGTGPGLADPMHGIAMYGEPALTPIP